VLDQADLAVMLARGAWFAWAVACAYAVRRLVVSRVRPTLEPVEAHLSAYATWVGLFLIGMGLVRSAASSSTATTRTTSASGPAVGSSSTRRSDCLWSSERPSS
jgi:hypothetical protein